MVPGSARLCCGICVPHRRGGGDGDAGGTSKDTGVPKGSRGCSCPTRPHVAPQGCQEPLRGSRPPQAPPVPGSGVSG